MLLCCGMFLSVSMFFVYYYVMCCVPVYCSVMMHSRVIDCNSVRCCVKRRCMHEIFDGRLRFIDVIASKEVMPETV